MSSVKLLLLALLLVAASALAGCVDNAPAKGEPTVISLQGGEETRAFDLEPIEWNVTAKVDRTYINSCARADCRLQEDLGLREPSYKTTINIHLERLPKMTDELGVEAVVSNGETNRTTSVFRGDDQGKATKSVEFDGRDNGKIDVVLFVSYKGNKDPKAIVAQGALAEDQDSTVLASATPGATLFGDGAIDGQGDQRDINVTLYGVWGGTGFAYEAWLKGAGEPQSLGFFNLTESQSYELGTSVPAGALKSFTIEVTLEPVKGQPGVSSGAVVLQSVFIG